MKKQRNYSLIAAAEFTPLHTSIVTLVNVSSVDGKHTKEGAIALWDTGADFCGISNELAKQLELKQVGTQSVRYGNNAVSEEPVYLANIKFPQTGRETSVTVTGFNGGQHEVVIGMTLIRTGSFIIEPKPDGGFSFIFMDEH